jgi:hypothetical protein
LSQKDGAGCDLASNRDKIYDYGVARKFERGQ